jgi:hypothetical protein
MTLLIVVTQRNPHNGRDISRCVDSVAAALPQNATHLIIDCHNLTELRESRIAALDLSEFIVFVDDDDYITPDSLTMCLDALVDTEYGVAFTEEIRVIGNNIVKSRPAVTYAEVLQSPCRLHHLAMIRTSAVTGRGKALAAKPVTGTEWVMKVDAGFNKGIIHIPRVGYYWTQHDTQLHKSTAHQTPLAYKTTAETISEMRTWEIPAGRIAKYTKDIT